MSNVRTAQLQDDAQQRARTRIDTPTSHSRFVRPPAGREPRQRRRAAVTVPADRRSGCHFAYSAIRFLESWCRTFPVFVARRCIPRHTLHVMCVPLNGDGTHITCRARRLALVSPGHTSSPARQSGCGSSALAARPGVAASGVGSVSRVRSGSGSSVGVRAVPRLGRVGHHQ